MKKRNPTDATLRNVRAATKRLAALGREVRALQARIRALELKR